MICCFFFDRCYVDIRKYVTAAEALMEVRDAYEVKGSFADIAKICNLVSSAKSILTSRLLVDGLVTLGGQLLS
jgi:hypothetical protein